MHRHQVLPAFILVIKHLHERRRERMLDSAKNGGRIPNCTDDIGSVSSWIFVTFQD